MAFWLNLMSGIFGAAGTFICAASTYGDEPLSGSVFGGPIVNAHNEKVRKRNARRKFWQRIGLVILGFGFLFQIAALFVR